MGVSSLTTFVKANYQHLGKEVYLRDIVKEHGGRISLVVDGLALLSYVMTTLENDFKTDNARPAVPSRDLLGGDYRDFHFVLKNLIEKFNADGVSLVVVVDGARGGFADKIESALRRDEQQLENSIEVDKFCRGKRASIPEEYIWPPLVREQFMSTLATTTTKCEVAVVPVGDADCEIYRRFIDHRIPPRGDDDDDSDDEGGPNEEQNTYAILAQDSDFFILENCLYIPIDTLQFSSETGVRCTVFDQTKLLNLLKFDTTDVPFTRLFSPTEKLVELSCLLGNDFTRNYTRKNDVQRSLISKLHNKMFDRINELTRIVNDACDLDDAKLAEKYPLRGRATNWRKENVDNEAEKTAESEAIGIERLPFFNYLFNKDTQFHKSVKYAREWYTLRIRDTDIPEENEHFRRFIYDCVGAGVISHSFVSIALHSTYWHPPVLEAPHPDQLTQAQRDSITPLVSDITRPLRQVLYSIVNVPVVVEHVPSPQLTKMIVRHVCRANNLPLAIPNGETGELQTVETLTPDVYHSFTSKVTDEFFHSCVHVCLPSAAFSPTTIKQEGSKKSKASFQVPTFNKDPLTSNPKFNPAVKLAGLALRYILSMNYFVAGTSEIVSDSPSELDPARNVTCTTWRSLDPGHMHDHLRSSILRKWELDSICSHVLILANFPSEDGSNRVPRLLIDMDVASSIRTVSLSSTYQLVVELICSLAAFLATAQAEEDVRGSLCDSLPNIPPYAIFDGSLFALACAAGGNCRSEDFTSRIVNVERPEILQALSILEEFRDAILVGLPDSIFSVLGGDETVSAASAVSAGGIAVSSGMSVRNIAQRMYEGLEEDEDEEDEEDEEEGEVAEEEVVVVVEAESSKKPQKKKGKGKPQQQQQQKAPENLDAFFEEQMKLRDEEMKKLKVADEEVDEKKEAAPETPSAATGELTAAQKKRQKRKEKAKKQEDSPTTAAATPVSPAVDGEASQKEIPSAKPTKPSEKKESSSKPAGRAAALAAAQKEAKAKKSKSKGKKKTQHYAK